MSAHLAIPATTFVLRAILQARVKAAYGTLTLPKVSVEPPPPRPPVAASGAPMAEPAGLMLFMHHAGPNPAWRNMYGATVDSQGARSAPSPLVLDLHYLLAAQGADLEREALLGIGMSAFHRNGVIPRPMIQAIMATITIPPNITKLLDTLPNEPLANPANQPESITISQQPVDIDTSTKLWSALHSPVRPCASYLVTTVFLDTGETFPAPKAVKTVDITGRPSADPNADPGSDESILVKEPGP